ncbi:unnamed protein product [Aureobasidium uvarum]|uniref:Uncharacterized protein n=1 Tax=Aureobasidium uvarum TaxID=2773716 RepID=A0A9N8KQ03_9PEZI|nr:unnamed protein product [Aureobasidium uvarum]
MTAPKKLIFNFSSEPVPNNYIRKTAATPRRKRATVPGTPATVIDDDNSPLFEPLSGDTPDQTQMNRKRANPPKTPGRTFTSGHNSQLQANTYQAIPQTPARPGTLTYRDGTDIERGVWQPGDGDGVRDSEFPNNRLFKERYRFFQSDIGSIERGINSPPHFVALDDKAVWDIVIAKKYTAKERATFWSLDFMANGVLRGSRRHKGRPALVASEADGHVEGGKPQNIGSVPWIMAGSKPNMKNYYLSGEEGGYKEAVFDTSTARTGAVNCTAPLEGSRNSGNRTEYARAAATMNLNGSKTEYAAKRKADQPLNPRHDRPKVGKYLHSTPSPEWPGGVRRLNKPPVARSVGRDGVDPPSGSEWSPATRVGGKTVYARHDYGEEEPQRINGRLVVSNARTPYARTPHADGAKTPFPNHSMGVRTPYHGSSFEAKTPRPQPPLSAPTPYYGVGEAQPNQQPLWQDVKRMGEELEQAKGILRMRDEEISNLKAQIIVLDTNERRAQQAGDATATEDGEIQRLKEEIMRLKRSLR